MGIEHRFGSVYHPQSQGIVERANRTIKNKLAKALAGTQMKWTSEHAKAERKAHLG